MTAAVASANPYESFVGELDPVAVIRETVPRVELALARLGAQRCEQPVAVGKWSPRQIVAHMADCELMHGVRLREALAEDGPVIRPFDQDRWAQRYASYDLATALAMLRALRHLNLQLIDGLSPEDRARMLTHPERGTFPVEVLLRTMAGHDRNHLLILEALASKPA